MGGIIALILLRKVKYFFKNILNKKVYSKQDLMNPKKIIGLKIKKLYKCY